MDEFILATTTLVFSTLIVIASGAYLVKNERIERVHGYDKLCRLIFPSLLLVITVYPFLLYW